MGEMYTLRAFPLKIPHTQSTDPLKQRSSSAAFRFSSPYLCSLQTHIHTRAAASFFRYLSRLTVVFFFIIYIEISIRKKKEKKNVSSYYFLHH